VDGERRADEEDLGQLARLEDAAFPVLSRNVQPDFEGRPPVPVLAHARAKDEGLPLVEDESGLGRELDRPLAELVRVGRRQRADARRYHARERIFRRRRFAFVIAAPILAPALRLHDRWLTPR
jgi:hypothetical protein